MPRKESGAVPEGNGPIPQQEEFGSGQPTLEGVYRLFEEGFKTMGRYIDQLKRKLDNTSDEEKSMEQHVTSLEQDARQPRLALEADGPEYEDSRAHGGRRYSRTSDAWG